MPTRSPGADPRALAATAPAVQAVTVVPPAPAIFPQIEQLGTLAGAIVAILGFVALIARYLTRDVKRDLDGVRKDLNHEIGKAKANSEAAATMFADDRRRLSDLERGQTRLDTQVLGLDAGQRRIEAAIAAMGERIDHLPARLAELIGKP